MFVKFVPSLGKDNLIDFSDRIAIIRTEGNYRAKLTMDEDLYKQVQEFVKEYEIDFPTASFFINQAVKDKLQELKKVI